MAVERAAGGTSLIDVLDRVLDKGIVIDAWVRVSLVGIDLITVEARVVVASIDTYLKYSEAVGQVAPVSRPQAELAAHQNVIAENAALARGAGRRARAPARSAAAERGAASRVEGITRGTGPAAAPVAHARRESTSDAKLALVEFLLTSTDLRRRRAARVDWLVAHTPASKQAVVAVADPRHRPAAARRRARRLVATRSSTSRSPATTRRTRWSRRCDRARADLLRRRDGRVPRAARGAPFHAIPLRADDERGRARAAARERGGPELAARSRLAGADARASRCRGCSAAQLLAETRFGQERMLLYSIINAVTDPILLTDTEGKLIIANTHAEKLFAAPEDASEGWRRAVALNNMLFSAALSTRRSRRPSGAARAAAGRSARRIGPAVRAAQLARRRTRGRAPASCRFCATSPTCARASEEIEENYRTLRVAQAQVRDERDRLDLIIDSVADPIVVTDPGRRHRPDERAGRAAVQRAGNRRASSRSGGCGPTTRTSRRSSSNVLTRSGEQR